TIAQHCGVTPLGCTVQDLIAGAQALGFNAGLLTVSREPAEITALSQSAPVVAMIDLGSLPTGGPMFQWHFVLPLGVSHDIVSFHDPADGPDRQAKLEDFLAAWATAGYRGVHKWTP